jgi:proteasome lid subunit RPN8/RPN11
MMATLTVPRRLLDQMVEHARETYPAECCGILAGEGERATHLFRLRNISPTPEVAYLMDASEQFWAFRNVRHNGLRFLAVYHSHPLSAPYPSLIDVASAHYKEVYYPIVSLARTDKAEILAYRIVDGVVSAADLVVE